MQIRGHNLQLCAHYHQRQNYARQTVIATLIESCKIVGINPSIWLSDASTKLAMVTPQAASETSCPGSK
tara:strand:- start:5424 stop:5630 length:207 start_codon:yes stop_codon:yes gene_type:complete